MKKTTILSGIFAVSLLVSCVSKKKYTELQGELYSTQMALANTAAEKKALEDKFSKIEARVQEYNSRINSLKESNDKLQDSNDEKLVLEGAALMSANMRKRLLATLSEVDQEQLAQAQTLEDSVNLAISHNFKKKMTESDGSDQEDIQVDIDQTVVMISVSDKLLFNTGSYVVSPKANNLLKRLAEVVNSEPSMEVMVEGHTDPRSISTAVVQDNWDLSVKRATSIVRKLVNDYNVAPEQMIAAGRSSYKPVVDNNNPENMAKNRRTRIVIIPDLDKFFALL